MERVRSVSIVEIAANIAACTFNEGATAYLLLMHSFDIDIDRNAYCEYQDQDSNEIQKREKNISRKR